VQEPDTQMAPSHCELLVQDLRQVPTVAPLQTWERPQSPLSRHDDDRQPELRQSLLPQWLSREQTQRLLMQSPRSQGLLPEQVSGTQVPLEPPEHVAPLIEQSSSSSQVWVEHVPTTGGMQVEPNPQSVSTLHAPLLLLTRASADTWKSLNTTRPHWLVGVAATGVLNVMLSSMSSVDDPRALPYIQRWLGGLMADRASQRGSLIDICPTVDDAPTLRSHCANASPLGKERSTLPVIGSL
jgi:hypothetical protein